ncbi:uncharacterized protein [Anabrus simplex]|uniref:uncharacterized protein isoform X2 n=1 Tax=Anabrus simplex TaxID=316456 RepID=UPI0035A3658D
MQKIVSLFSMLLLLPYLTAEGTGEACSVTYYLQQGERREFRFSNGPMFRAQLSCVFTFAGPVGERLVVSARDVNMATGRNSCEEDAIRVYGMQNGELSLLDTVCGVQETSNPVSSNSNVIVVTFNSDEDRTPRSFILTITSEPNYPTTTAAPTRSTARTTARTTPRTSAGTSPTPARRNTTVTTRG